MITETFLHCKGVGPKLQAKLLNAGFNNWDSILNNSANLPIKGNLATNIVKELAQSKKALDDSDIIYLVKKFSTKDQWRILAEFFNHASYFDIETTGFTAEMEEITLIVCYHKGKLYNFIKDENLDDFLDLLDDIDLLVSFNGNSFDVPHLLRSYHIPKIPCAHMDLRWLCYHCNFKHGLKTVEKEMNIERPPDLKDLDGMEAVYLWQRWKSSGDLTAKQKLIRYCQADVISLILVAKRILEEHGPNVTIPDVSELWAKLDS